MKLVDKKDVDVSLKKKKLFFGSECIEKKQFKLTNLGQKCDMEKTFSMKSVEFALIFKLNSPIR